MLLGRLKLPHGASGDAERHVGLGHSNQDLSIGCDGERLFEIGRRLRRTAESVPALRDVGEHAGLDVQVGMARLVEPLQRPQAGFNRWVEQLLFAQRGADLRIDRRTNRWMVGRRQGRRLLQRPQPLRVPAGCPQRDAAQPTRIGALVRRQLILSNFIQQRQRAAGLTRLRGELGRLHQVLGISRRRSAVEEVRKGPAEPLGEQP